MNRPENRDQHWESTCPENADNFPPPGTWNRDPAVPVGHCGTFREYRLTKQLVEKEADERRHERFELGVEEERQMRAIGFTLWRLFRMNVEARFPIRVVGMVCEVTVCEHAPIVRLIVHDTCHRIPRLPPLCREARIDPALVCEVMNLDLAAIMVVDVANELLDEFARVSAKTHWDRAKLSNL